MVNKKGYYTTKKSKGLCPSCGAKLPNGHPWVLCDRCIDIQHEYRKIGEYRRTSTSDAMSKPIKEGVKRPALTKEEYHRRKDVGLCVKCGKENDRWPMVYCSECATIVSHRNKLRHKYGVRDYAKRKARGVCITCGTMVEESSPSTIRCFACAEKERVRQAKATAKLPACAKCGYKLRGNDVGKKYCSACEERLSISSGVKKEGVKNMDKIISNEFSRGFEVGRKLGRKAYYDEFAELIDEIVVGPVKVDELKNILRLVKV